jgi:hypothetical protein
MLGAKLFDLIGVSCGASSGSSSQCEQRLECLEPLVLQRQGCLSIHLAVGEHDEET